MHTQTRALPYDHLIIATGAQSSYFGRDHWSEFAPPLKSVEDAFILRHRILSAFEQAEMETDPERRAAFLEFVVVGAGPTGVEMAGAIAELARHSLAHDFRSVTPSCARIKLVQSGDRILPAFSEASSHAAQKGLEKLGVEIVLGTRVTELDAGLVRLGEKNHRAETVVWAAGVKASPASSWLNAEADRSGRVFVDEHMRVAGDDCVYVVGDTAAHLPEGATRPLPGLAPVAKQMGRHAARAILAKVEGRASPAPFRYRDWGSLATIGRNKAVADFGKLKFSGFFGWAVWSLVHVAYLEGFKNRLSVGLSWAWSYLTWQRGARLILGSGSSSDPKGY